MNRKKIKLSFVEYIKSYLHCFKIISQHIFIDGYIGAVNILIR